MTLTTTWPGIRNDLPVAVEWPAFCQSRNNHSDERNSEEPTYYLESELIRLFPYLTCQTLEELRYSEFRYPKTMLISAVARAGRGLTYNAAYMIRDASTSLLPTIRRWMSGEVRPVVMVLLVPHIKTKWTKAMRASSGMMLNAMILSSLNNFSVLTYRPDIRTMIMANAKPVHHHESRRVGLLAIAFLASGGVEYQSRGRSIIEAHRPLQSRELKGGYPCSLSTKAFPRCYST